MEINKEFHTGTCRDCNAIVSIKTEVWDEEYGIEKSAECMICGGTNVEVFDDE